MTDDKADRIRATRERELAKTHTTLPPKFTSAVVGVSFTPRYPNNLYELEVAWNEAAVRDEPLAAVLIRNPDNEYDAAAVEVHIPALGASGMVGHLTRPIAARLAPELDAGEIWEAHVVQVRIHPDHMDRPGLEIELEHIRQPRRTK